jgi:[glutamine synthetase] adenylyltransferase / [glutamine synthetase]-adenylyl-L-tyrosine phosphorylase
MPDLAQLESELIGRYPEPWVRHHMASLPETYFASFDAVDVTRHLGLMRELTEDRPVRLWAEPAGGGDWRIDIVGYDCFQFLSTLCNLLTVRGLSIVSGQVFTSQPPAVEPARPAPKRGGWTRRPPRSVVSDRPDRRPRIVDVFRVRPIKAEDRTPDWDEFQAELTTLTRLLRDNKYEEVHHRLIRRFVAALGHYQPEQDAPQPIDLTIDSDGLEAATLVRIRARDSLGFLSLTASALALCGIRIVQAEIRTHDDAVADQLWVTDRWGHKITSPSKLRELRLSLILIENFSRRLPHATDPEAALLHFSQFATETMSRPDWAKEFAALEQPEVLEALARVLGESHFLWEDFLHAQPENVLPMICDPTAWNRARTPNELATELDASIAAAPTPEERCRAIRRFRDREIFRADIRSILGRSAGQGRFSAELSDVAEALLRAAFVVAVEQIDLHSPQREIGQALPMVLCALGKFGGRELGFASDLEVMIVYDDRRALPNPEGMAVGGYFDSFVAALRAVLGSRQGSTFDLDFRLRPYGRSGAPATSLSTFFNYYRAGGPAWGYERQALIKLRVIAGDPELGRIVETHRDQFVYGPEPFDLACYQRMRRLQVEQRVLPGTINAKFSPGALVDVEYFVQAMQIAHGGHDLRLRSPNTLQALAALEAAGRLSLDQVESLRSGYQFFRRLIDALRMVHGHAQDLTVPPAGTEEFVLLARRMRLPGPEALQSNLEARLHATRSLVDRLSDFLGGAGIGTPELPLE